MRTFAILLLTLAAPQAPERWFPTGDPELLTANADAALSRRWSWEEYAATTEPLRGRPRFAVLQKRPALSEAATFGVNFSFGGKNRSYAVDGSERDGYRLYVDADGDGDLSDAEMLRFEKVDGKYSTTFERQVADTASGTPAEYTVRIRAVLDEAVPPDGTTKVPVLRIYRISVRSGVAQLGALRVPFALVGHSGLYDQPADEVVFDGTQRYQVSDGQVKFGDAAYAFHVDRYGRALALTPTTNPVPERPSLEAGSAAPAFSFRDLDNRDHRLADYRGKVVLLEFWATWCGPCRAEAPGLAELYSQFAPQGLVIIGINPNDTLADVQSFLTQFKVSWPTVREPQDGPIHRTFRVTAWPTHVLIGRDGRILANQIGAGDMRTLVAGAIR